MPHFVVECNTAVLELQSPELIMQTVYDSADSTGLFSKGDIKVRINPYAHYNVGNTKNNFIHIFGNIMEGRTSEQKKTLSETIVRQLKFLFPEVPIISINIRDFEKASYYNRTMVG